jgi:hypothetical protein
MVNTAKLTCLLISTGLLLSAASTATASKPNGSNGTPPGLNHAQPPGLSIAPGSDKEHPLSFCLDGKPFPPAQVPPKGGLKIGIELNQLIVPNHGVGQNPVHNHLCNHCGNFEPGHVPEPNSIALVISGFAVLLITRRRLCVR